MKRILGILAALIGALTWLDALLLGRMQGDLAAGHARANRAAGWEEGTPLDLRPDPCWACGRRWRHWDGCPLRPRAVEMDDVLRAYGGEGLR